MGVGGGGEYLNHRNKKSHPLVTQWNLKHYPYTHELRLARPLGEKLGIVSLTTEIVPQLFSNEV